MPLHCSIFRCWAIIRRTLIFGVLSYTDVAAGARKRINVSVGRRSADISDTKMVGGTRHSALQLDRCAVV